MGILKYFKYNFKSVMLSKMSVNKVTFLPKIKKVTFLFLVSFKEYKLFFCLFFIILSLFFGGLGSFKRKLVRQFLLVKVQLENSFFFFSGICNE